MSPIEVRHALDAPYQSFMKGPSSSFPADAFDGIGMHVYYDKDGKCEAVEVFRPGVATYLEVDLLSMKYVDVEQIFTSEDDKVEVHGSGFDALESGVSVFSSDKDEEINAFCESILVFKDGYWSSLDSAVTIRRNSSLSTLACSASALPPLSHVFRAGGLEQGQATCDLPDRCRTGLSSPTGP